MFGSMNRMSSTTNCAECCGVSIGPSPLAAQDIALTKTKQKEPSIFAFNVTPMEGFSKLIAETVGTAFLMFGGCMGGLSWSGEAPPSAISAASFGLVVMIIIQCYGHISGAHLNPAVTLATVIFRMISIPMAILYILAQLIGATLGFRLLKALTPSRVFALSNGDYGVCQTVPHEDLSEIDAFIIEYIATSVLISICCALWDPRNTSKQDSVPLKFGLAITILSIVFGPATGCSMNPVRTFAPAFWAQNYPAHWVYWSAPMLAALVTSLGYKILFLEKSEDDLDMVQPLRHDDMPKV